MYFVLWKCIKFLWRDYSDYNWSWVSWINPMLFPMIDYKISTDSRHCLTTKCKGIKSKSTILFFLKTKGRKEVNSCSLACRRADFKIVKFGGKTILIRLDFTRRREEEWILRIRWSTYQWLWTAPIYTVQTKAYPTVTIWKNRYILKWTTDYTHWVIICNKTLRFLTPDLWNVNYWVVSSLRKHPFLLALRR